MRRQYTERTLTCSIGSSVRTYLAVEGILLHQVGKMCSNQRSFNGPAAAAAVVPTAFKTFDNDKVVFRNATTHQRMITLGLAGSETTKQRVNLTFPLVHLEERAVSTILKLSAIT